MKTTFLLPGFFLLSFAHAQLPEWKYEATFGAGWTAYEEKGSTAPIESDWSAGVSELRLEGQGRIGNTYPFLRLRFVGSGTETEEWKENGVKVQENDMSMVGTDLELGMEFPIQLDLGVFTPSLGFVTGFQSYEREDFVLFGPGGSIFGRNSKVTEDVFTAGIGGGLALELPMGESWLLGLETYAHWLFYTYAENDGFDVSIDGDDGFNWDSALWMAKALKNPGQILGIKLQADLMMTNGGDTVDGGNVIEWPQSESQTYSLALFWRGEF